jgi:hypothetical protein
MPAKIEIRALYPKIPDVTSGQATTHFTFSLAHKHGVMVPLGVPNAKNQPSNPYFQFNYSIAHQPETALIFEVRNSNGKLYYSLNIDQAFMAPGEYLLLWDGFDSTDTFDSRCFDHNPLQASLTAIEPEGRKTLSVFIAAHYQVVPWLDVIISLPKKRIEITLRTHFTDGGAAVVSRLPTPDHSARLKSFEQLLSLAQEGLRYYWSRNDNHPVGKNIILPDGNAYEVFVDAVNTSSQAIKTPKIVYQSNARLRRSRNWEFSRLLFYNVGQLRRAGKWHEKAEAQANAGFKLIAAHEIGHEILLAYGGHIYSKTHKGSSTLLTQRPLGNYHLPATGEIDLMRYYVTQPEKPGAHLYNRSVASEADVRSLIWLAQIAYQLV